MLRVIITSIMCMTCLGKADSFLSWIMPWSGKNATLDQHVTTQHGQPRRQEAYTSQAHEGSTYCHNAETPVTNLPQAQEPTRKGNAQRHVSSRSNVMHHVSKGIIPAYTANPAQEKPRPHTIYQRVCENCAGYMQACNAMRCAAPSLRTIDNTHAQQGQHLRHDAQEQRRQGTPHARCAQSPKKSLASLYASCNQARSAKYLMQNVENKRKELQHKELQSERTTLYHQQRLSSQDKRHTHTPHSVSHEKPSQPHEVVLRHTNDDTLARTINEYAYAPSENELTITVNDNAQMKDIQKRIFEDVRTLPGWLKINLRVTNHKEPEDAQPISTTQNPYAITHTPATVEKSMYVDDTLQDHVFEREAHSQQEKAPLKQYIDFEYFTEPLIEGPFRRVPELSSKVRSKRLPSLLEPGSENELSPLEPILLPDPNESSNPMRGMYIVRTPQSSHARGSLQKMRGLMCDAHSHQTHLLVKQIGGLLKNAHEINNVRAVSCQIATEKQKREYIYQIPSETLEKLGLHADKDKYGIQSAYLFIPPYPKSEWKSQRYIFKFTINGTFASEGNDYAAYHDIQCGDTAHPCFQQARYTAYHEKTPVIYCPMRWPGANSMSQREQYGASLIGQYIENILSQDDAVERIEHFSHSHGGNTIYAAYRALASTHRERAMRKVFIYNLAKPTRPEMPAYTIPVNTIYNFYRRDDAIQFAGSFSYRYLMRYMSNPFSQARELLHPRLRKEEGSSSGAFPTVHNIHVGGSYSQSYNPVFAHSEVRSVMPGIMGIVHELHNKLTPHSYDPAYKTTHSYIRDEGLLVYTYDNQQAQELPEEEKTPSNFPLESRDTWARTLTKKIDATRSFISGAWSAIRNIFSPYREEHDPAVTWHFTDPHAQMKRRMGNPET